MSNMEKELPQGAKARPQLDFDQIRALAQLTGFTPEEVRKQAEAHIEEAEFNRQLAEQDLPATLDSLPKY